MVEAVLPLALYMIAMSLDAVEGHCCPVWEVDVKCKDKAVKTRRCADCSEPPPDNQCSIYFCFAYECGCIGNCLNADNRGKLDECVREWAKDPKWCPAGPEKPTTAKPTTKAPGTKKPTQPPKKGRSSRGRWVFPDGVTDGDEEMAVGRIGIAGGRDDTPPTIIGTIEEEEMFRHIDDNGDGMIDEQESIAFYMDLIENEIEAQKRGKENLQKVDSNKDGKATKEEFLTELKKHAESRQS